MMERTCPQAVLEAIRRELLLQVNQRLFDAGKLPETLYVTAKRKLSAR